MVNNLWLVFHSNPYSLNRESVLISMRIRTIFASNRQHSQLIRFDTYPILPLTVYFLQPALSSMLERVISNSNDYDVNGSFDHTVKDNAIE